MEMYRIVGSVETDALPLVRMTVPRALFVNGRQPLFIGRASAVTDCLFDARSHGVRIPIQFGDDDVNTPLEKRMAVDPEKVCGYVHDFVENLRSGDQYYVCDFLPSYVEKVKQPMALNEFVLGVSDIKSGVCTIQKIVKFSLVEMPSMF